MNAQQQQALSTFRSIDAWGAEHPDITGVTSSASAATGNAPGASSATPTGTSAPATSTTTTTSIGEQFALLHAAVNDAAAAAADQETLNRTILGLSAQAQQQRVELMSNQMVHVATIARTAIPDAVKMTEALRTPRKSRKTETLFSAAEAMATAGEQYKDALVASGLDANFPDELRGAAIALKNTVDERDRAVADRKGTEKAYSAALVRCRKAVDTLTVQIKRQFKGDRATVATWMQLRRIPKVKVQNPTGARVPVALPTSAPATVPATVPAPATAVTAAATAPEQQGRAA
ncbi:MAG: hypothetical protein ACHQQ3_06080 [Gemmatimonadales bacterium]